MRREQRYAFLTASAIPEKGRAKREVKFMELKITTLRALDFEARAGRDMLKVLKEAEKNSDISLRDVIDLFISCGEGYTPDMFDEWEGTFAEKVQAIFVAVGKYFGTDVKKGALKQKK